jgi:hypothetical protein
MIYMAIPTQLVNFKMTFVRLYLTPLNFSFLQRVTYWAERIGPLVNHISQVSCCAAFGAIQRNHMLFFEYFKIGSMYLIFFLNPKGIKWGYVGYHFPHC